MTIPTFDGASIEVDLPLAGTTGDFLAVPALIDAHVHFRTPGATHKEDWESGARAAIAGGVTTVLDMPNNDPPTIDEKTFITKKQIIQEQLERVGIPLRHHLYIGATPGNAKTLKQVAGRAIGVKLYMGSSTGGLRVDAKQDQEDFFLAAAAADFVLAVHADDEQEIQKQKALIFNPTVRDHSRIRSRAAATIAVERVIALAKKTGATVYLCHVSTAEEVEIIAKAKQDGVALYAEVTPHHLFLDESAYGQLGTLVQMNPPLRTPADRAALWQGIQAGVIDTVGSDHAPHTLAEKGRPYPDSPSGVPGIETTLPLLLTAAHEGKLTIEKIVELTRRNPERIFHLPQNDDWVVVDLAQSSKVDNAMLKTKCGWSPFAGWELTGWPVAVVLCGEQFLANSQ